MNPARSLLLAATPAVAVLLGGDEVSADCAWDDEIERIDCGKGALCEKQGVRVGIPCSDSESGCSELTRLHDVLVCEGCPFQQEVDVDLCGGGLCSCVPVSS
jgi:hypothetical protein